MNQAEYRLAVQSAGRGLFAKIVLSATISEEKIGLHIEYENTNGNEWIPSVGFGIKYAYEQIFYDIHNKDRVRGLTVKVNEIIGTTVDTREMTMVYVSAMAIWKALDIYPKILPIFNNENSSFTFPE